jgi:hypothetical protein
MSDPLKRFEKARLTAREHKISCEQKKEEINTRQKQVLERIRIAVDDLTCRIGYFRVNENFQSELDEFRHGMNGMNLSSGTKTERERVSIVKGSRFRVFRAAGFVMVQRSEVSHFEEWRSEGFWLPKMKKVRELPQSFDRDFLKISVGEEVEPDLNVFRPEVYYSSGTSPAIALFATKDFDALLEFVAEALGEESAEI